VRGFGSCGGEASVDLASGRQEERPQFSALMLNRKSRLKRGGFARPTSLPRVSVPSCFRCDLARHSVCDLAGTTYHIRHSRFKDNPTRESFVHLDAQDYAVSEFIQTRHQPTYFMAKFEIGEL
jgi:hypothetical protein